MVRLLAYVCAIILTVGTMRENEDDFYQVIPILIPLEKSIFGRNGILWTIGFSAFAIYYWSTIGFDNEYLIATLLSVVASQPI